MDYSDCEEQYRYMSDDDDEYTFENSLEPFEVYIHLSKGHDHVRSR